LTYTIPKWVDDIYFFENVPCVLAVITDDTKLGAFENYDAIKSQLVAEFLGLLD